LLKGKLSCCLNPSVKMTQDSCIVLFGLYQTYIVERKVVMLFKSFS